MGYEFRLSNDPELDEALAPHFGGVVSAAAPEREEIKQTTAASLMAVNPQLTVFQLRYEEIAAFEKISMEEARKRYRYVELNGPEGGNGIQITLHDNSAAVTVPFWQEGKKAEGVFSEILTYLQIIRRETGYDVFDPQTDKKLDLSLGLEESLACYQVCSSGKWKLIGEHLKSESKRKKKRPGI